MSEHYSGNARGVNATPLSGRRWVGSSLGSDLKTNFGFDPVNSITFFAS